MRILAGEHLHLLYDGAAYQTQSTSKGGHAIPAVYLGFNNQVII